MLTRRGFLTLSGAGLCATMAPPLLAAQTVTLGGDAFGSYWRLTLPAESDGGAASASIRAVVASVDALFSPWRATSEISRFNQSAGTDLQPVSDACRTVLAEALDIAAASGGAFDPTLGPLVARYGFGPLHDAEPGHFTQLALADGGLRKDIPGLSVDLCGIAKGHALDLAAAALEDLGIDAYLLDFGGELKGQGAHPGARPWQVALENPLTGGLAHLLALDGHTVATSGLAAQSYALGGHLYGHIIDPATQTPVLGETLSVSVLSASGMRADGWATALMALPHEDAVTLAEANGLDAVLLLRDGEAVKPVFTGRAADHLLA